MPPPTKLLIEYERLQSQYKQEDLLKIIADSIISLYSITKPYNYRRIYTIDVTQARSFERYLFPHTIYQIVVMPVTAAIEIWLDQDEYPYNLEVGESLNITTKSNLMALTNAATPGAENIRIYVFGRKND